MKPNDVIDNKMKFLLFCRRCISRQVVHYFGENLMPIKVYLTSRTIILPQFPKLSHEIHRKADV